MTDMERRTFPVEDAEVEVRQAESGEDEFVLKGHAAVFNSRSKPLGPPGQRFVEQIEPGAFSNALEDSDIRALFNHDPSELLARESAGTLDVGEDGEGLRYEAQLGDDTRSEFVRSKVERGEVTGNSFSFVVSEENESWNENPDDGEFPVRTIHEFDRVDDVGPVSYPAYPDATISERVEKRAAQMGGSDEPETEEESGPEVSWRDWVGEVLSRDGVTSVTLDTETLYGISGDIGTITAGVMTDSTGDRYIDLSTEDRQTDQDIRRLLRDALQEEFGGDDTFIYIDATFLDENEVVYSIETDDDSGLFRVSYEIDDDNNVAFGEPEEVMRVTTFESVDEEDSRDRIKVVYRSADRAEDDEEENSSEPEQDRSALETYRRKIRLSN